MTNRLLRWLWLVLALAVLARLITLGLYPLMGTTEPRYAEISRKMLELGDWVTPWYDWGVPFWGKPPMSFWGSALTMAVFGANEFGARLGPFLATAASFALLWAWPRRADSSQGQQDLPVMAELVCLTSLAGFVSAGAVMTDMFMTLGTTLCMVAFWRSMNEPGGQGRWGWWFFVGVAVGLLSKGPVATVLTGIAITLWLLAAGWQPGALQTRWRMLWQRLPWVGGSLLAAVLTLPWYLLAEHRTPGFLNYFIVGEHIQRFLVSGWTGDLYGAGHPEARGTIFWFALVGWMPWPVVVPLWAALCWRRSSGKAATEDTTAPSNATTHGPGELAYLAAWVAAPLLFFTVARNILPSYVLPGLPAFGLLVAMLGMRAARAKLGAAWLWLASVLMPAAVCIGLYANPGFMNDRSQRDLLTHWSMGEPLVYLAGRPLSADFYSHGQAVLVDKPAEMDLWLSGPSQKDGKPVTLVLERPVYEALTPAQRASWRIVAEHGGYVMLRR